MSYDFSTRSHAKWILTGEHSVLRGYPALVFPLASYHLQLHYQESNNLTVTNKNNHEPLKQANLTEVLLNAISWLNIPSKNLNGHFVFDNNIPIGSGLGASAALCVAIANWFVWKQWLAPVHLLSFAQRLEDYFHGKSSGLDIIGTSKDTGMLFMQGDASVIEQNWQPNWFLSYSGKPGVTATGIHNVERLWQTQPEKAKAIDQQMNQSVETAITALKIPSITDLVTAIELACNCFNQWGLITPLMETHMQQLNNAGALAVKPTGSGNGGYILSLWQPGAIPSGINVIPLNSR